MSENFKVWKILIDRVNPKEDAHYRIILKGDKGSELSLNGSGKNIPDAKIGDAFFLEKDTML